MEEIRTSGKCLACGVRFSGAGIRRHLSACASRPEGEGSAFDIRARAGPYWLYLECSVEATLADLDALFRSTWVEWCGHMSAFDIAGRRYMIDTDGLDGMWIGATGRFDDGGMGVRLGEALRAVRTFGYEYDFGSPTELELEVLEERASMEKNGGIRILARNDPPEFLREDCEAAASRAEKICVECEELLCSRCIAKHKADMVAPIVNSPRMGVCGYDGEEEEGGEGDWEDEGEEEEGEERIEPIRVSAAPGLNEPCSCGSGRKYKRCCGGA
jgi:hypothetical protein